MQPRRAPTTVTPAVDAAMRFPAAGRVGRPLRVRPAVGVARHGSGTWRGTRSRQPPAASAFAFGIQRRTWARIQLSELHSEATLASPQMRSAIQRCDFSARSRPAPTPARDPPAPEGPRPRRGRPGRRPATGPPIRPTGASSGRLSPSFATIPSPVRTPARTGPGSAGPVAQFRLEDEPPGSAA